MAVTSSRVTLSFKSQTLHMLAEICICRALSRLGQRPLSLFLDGMWSSFSTVFTTEDALKGVLLLSADL